MMTMIMRNKQLADYLLLQPHPAAAAQHKLPLVG